MIRTIADFAGFQGLWWACILGSANNLVAPALVAFGLFVSLHLLFITKTFPRLAGLFALVVVGLIGNELLMRFGIIQYPNGAGWILGSPFWILLLWMGIGHSVLAGLSWVIGKPAVAFVVFGVAGALSYKAGIQLNAASMPGSAVYGYLFIALTFGAIGVLLAQERIKLRGA